IFQKEQETNTNLYQPIFSDLTGVFWQTSPKKREDIRLT
ncbi:unnamed protein product, partial [marine sediment metagenome]